ncbi:multidrug effflux MFS transporter [Photobacterium makurazakiensis]|uniref:multidrug effflux MFS transporter n=1 Tax=Photobacterium makurazakiensis TaxID=2910234 RepID=UPI003D11C0D3
MTQKSLVPMMVALILLSPMAIDIYLPAMPMMAESFGVSLVNVQDTISWFIFSLGFGQLIAGPMADKYGRRPVAITGITLYFLSSVMAYLSYSFDMLLVARLLQGFGACATTVIAFCAARDCFAERSGRVISYLNGTISFIPALAPILGGWITANYGWEHNFSFMAVFSLVVGILVINLFPETLPEGTKSNKVSYWPIATNGTFLFHALMCLLAMAVLLTFVSIAPGWLMVEVGLDINSFTMWFGANAVINIISCMFAPRFMDAYGQRKTLVTGLAVIIAAGILMKSLGHNGQAWGFMLPMFLATVGVAFLLGSAAGKALSPFGHCAGTAAALFGLFQMSGSSVLISITQKIGLDSPDLMTLQMFLLIPLLLVMLVRKSNEKPARACD